MNPRSTDCEADALTTMPLRCFLEHGIEWKKGIGICTDGVANITGHRTGVVAKVKNVSHPEILSTYCIIHHEHLVAKKCLKSYTN